MFYIDSLVDENESSINVLNDDCMIMIFRQLPLIARLEAEKVCKKWKTLVDSSWCNVTSIDLSHQLWGREHFTLDVLENVLKRAGRYLRTINMDESYWFGNLSFKYDVISLVVKYCPNVVNLSGPVIGTKIGEIADLAEKCPNIKTLGIKGLCGTFDVELAQLCPKLTSLDIVGRYSFTGNCLHALNVDLIESIVLPIGHVFDLSNMKALKNFVNLKSLTIWIYFEENVGTISVEIPLGTERLLSLMLPFWSRRASFEIDFAKLTNLTCLELTYNHSVGNDLLRNVAKHCKGLKKLFISGCSVNNGPVAAVLRLPKLEVVVMDDMNYINDCVFDGMPSIKKIKCENWRLSREPLGLVKLCNNSPNIVKLNLGKRISSDVEETLLQAIQNKYLSKRKETFKLLMNKWIYTMNPETCVAQRSGPRQLVDNDEWSPRENIPR